MSNVLAHAIRFADLWAVDHHQMVEEIYSPTIHMESMCRLDHAAVESGAELHDLEDRLATMIPEHRHELVRVIAGRRHACLETTVLAPGTGEYAPACVWWWMDDDGRVDEEVGFFDWSRRSTNCSRSHGLVPPNDGRVRGTHATLVDALTSGDLDAHVAPDCVVEAVGNGLTQSAIGPVDVQELVVDGAVAAALVLGREGRRVWRGTVVVTAGTDDRLISVRWYGDPATAVDADAVHAAMNLDRRPTPQ